MVRQNILKGLNGDLPRARGGRRGVRAAVRLDVEERGSVDAVETAHEDRIWLDRDDLHERSSNRIGAQRRAERKDARRPPIGLGALLHKIAPRHVHPVEDFGALVAFEPYQPWPPGLVDLDPADGAFGRPLPRAVVTAGERRAYAADEDKARVRPLRQRHLQLACARGVLVHG